MSSRIVLCNNLISAPPTEPTPIGNLDTYLAIPPSYPLIHPLSLPLPFLYLEKEREKEREAQMGWEGGTWVCNTAH